jgi:tetraprenyl-beta-curcumene synthase
VASALDGIAVAGALATYRRTVVPGVRAELARRELAAGAIPDPELRGAALASLREKGLNAEATAVFAILAPRARRAGALRAMVALQTAIDYLDTLGERAVEDPLASGLALHRALGEAVSPDAGRSDWYGHYPQREDGGYLAALVETCQGEIEALPAHEAVRATLRRAAERCGEGQSHTHAAALERVAERCGEGRSRTQAAALDDAGPLREWAEGLPAPPGYEWWELAAGACSSVAIHAAIAAAADPAMTAAEAELIDAAYFPPLGALTVLLDDLIDREADAAGGEHNYVAYYESSAVAAERLALLVERAQEATARLRRRRRHEAILAGVAGFYLSAPAARGAYAAPVRARLLACFGPELRLLEAAMRRRRRG